MTALFRTSRLFVLSAVIVLAAAPARAQTIDLGYSAANAFASAPGAISGDSASIDPDAASGALTLTGGVTQDNVFLGGLNPSAGIGTQPDSFTVDLNRPIAFTVNGGSSVTFAQPIDADISADRQGVAGQYTEVFFGTADVTQIYSLGSYGTLTVDYLSDEGYNDGLGLVDPGLYADFTYTAGSAAATPEPSSLIALLVGVIGIGVLALKARRRVLSNSTPVTRCA